jgi:hypothetical protein
MSGVRFWQSPKWRELFALDDDLAEAEGLAAGTGLLTGGLVDATPVQEVACPRCGGVDDVEVESVDLIASEITRRCRGCGLAWTVAEAAGRPAR